MTLKRIGMWMLIFVTALIAGQVSAEDQPTISKPADRVSYGIGIDAARKMKDLSMEVNVDLVVKGIKDELAGKPLLSERDLRRTMTMFEVELKKRERLRNAPVVPEANMKKGEAFLAENRKKQGVVTLPSGLQYKVLKEGSGKKPTDADTVELRYRGTLLDGKEFEKSVEGKASAFEVATAIPGLREALKLMPLGSMWQIFIPPKLGYGTEGRDRTIGPNTLLIYQVELLGIK
jgi:FKBP-type peptidyl-prolyl cis-trans isomerase